jgi:excinuclease ABC subunit C
MDVTPALALAAPQRDRLRRRVRALAQNRPAVYRMVDPHGRVLYVGKARRLRPRLLSYFRARYPDEKAARILHATSALEWDYAPSEFAALLGELRQIQSHRPPFNVRMNRRRRTAFVRVSGGAAPKVMYSGTAPGQHDTRLYGPFLSAARLQEALHHLQDLLGLRDCALDMPMAYSEQGDLFAPARRAACLRYELGTCSGPCAGFVTEEGYRRRVDTAIAFLEIRGIAPLDRVIREMTAAARARDFERAAWWRARFEALEWLLAAAVRVHAAIEALSFVYLDPGAYGDDRAYVIRRATVRAAAPAPHTPIEHDAFRALVAAHVGSGPEHGPIAPDGLDETLLLLRWFRTHPSALTRTVPLRDWLERTTPPA